MGEEMGLGDSGGLLSPSAHKALPKTCQDVGMMAHDAGL